MAAIMNSVDGERFWRTPAWQEFLLRCKQHQGHSDYCFLRGRRTNSPLQFGQTLFMTAAHFSQKVHS